MESSHTLILATLTIEGSYARNIERPAATVADTVQFWFAPETQWRIKTYAIDHDIHVPADASSIRQLLDAAGLGGELELVPDAYAFYNPNRGHYRSQSTPRGPSAT